MLRGTYRGPEFGPLVFLRCSQASPLRGLPGFGGPFGGPEFPLVYIEWVDASRLSDSWMDMADIPDPYRHKCVSVGFLIAENKDAKIVVPTIRLSETLGILGISIPMAAC